MKAILFGVAGLLLATMCFAIPAHAGPADVVECSSEIWSPDACASMITAFKKDPYSYLSHITKTVSAASVALQSGANHDLISSWSGKMWDVIARSHELTGYLEAQKQDSRQVRVRDPSAANLENVPAFTGCYFLRENVVDEDNAVCESFLEPTARNFYLALTAFRNLCGDVNEARNCKALAPYYAGEASQGAF